MPIRIKSVQQSRQLELKAYYPDIYTVHTCIRLTLESSKRTWSYSDRADTKRTQSTSSKQWIHFLRWDLWPPTSNILNTKLLYSNSIWKINTKKLFWLGSSIDTVAHFHYWYLVLFFPYQQKNLGCITLIISSPE